MGAVSNGSAANLTCHLLGAKTEPARIEWKLEGVVLAESDSYEIVNQGYRTVLKVLEPSQDANFTCSFVYTRVNFEERVPLEFMGKLTDILIQSS